MSKALSWFPFDANAWLGGKIMAQTPGAQGIYMAACAIFWREQGPFPINNLKARYRQSKAVYADAIADLLDDGLIIETDGSITIPWLAETLITQREKHRKSVNSGRSGGNAKAKASSARSKASDANKKPTTRIDKNRIEENREEEEEEINKPTPTTSSIRGFISLNCRVDNDWSGWDMLVNWCNSKHPKLFKKAVSLAKSRAKNPPYLREVKDVAQEIYEHNEGQG